MRKSKIYETAFVLPEVLVTMALAGMLLAVVLALSVYSSRSFAAVANYLNLEQQSRVALDQMSREIRQTRRLLAFTPTSITLQDFDGNQLQYNFDADSHSLTRTAVSQTSTILTNCDFLQFSIFQRTPESNTFSGIVEQSISDAKMVQVTWACSRKILGAKVNSANVESAKIVLRNK